MKKKTLFDSIDVPSPCDKSWDEMIGGDVSRFCKHCEKDIYNISAMTRQEAKKLLFQSKEKVCIRMEREADGKIKTLKKQLHQITRHVPLAAGVLTASMILSGAANAQETKVESSKITVTQTADKNSKPTISGIITDSNGAAIPSVKVSLRNMKDNSTRFATSNDSGFYEFKDVEISIYEIIIAAQNGFESFVYKNLVAENDKNLQIRLTLIGHTTTDCFSESSNIPVTTETPPINTNVTYQEMVPFPISERMVLGIPSFPIPTKTKLDKSNKQTKTSQITFTIFAPNGEVIPEAQINLTNQETQQNYTASTNENGVALFKRVIKGRYEAAVSASHFKSHKQVVHLQQSVEPNIEIILEIPTFTGVVSINWSEIPTFNAIIQDDVENVKKSINSGFSVNTKDSSGKTALHFAVENANLKSLIFYCQKGQK